MNAPSKTHEERVLTSLLLVALITAGVALAREGPNFDNVIDGWNLFTIAFFSGALAGFLVWTRVSGVTPTFRLAGPHRNPWLAALVLGLACAAAASYLNRTFAAPAGRSITAELDAITEGKGGRWHVTVKMPDGRYQRYVIPQDAAAALKNEKMVRLSVARGALGYDYIAGFEPFRQ